MSETINVNFKMNINNQGEKYTVQFDEIGKRYFRNKKTFIRMKEPMINENKSNNLILICDHNEIIIIRNGFVSMKQAYKEKEYTIGRYENSQVSSEITTYTNRYQYSKNCILLNYDILIEKEIIGNYQMEINIKGEGSLE